MASKPKEKIYARPPLTEVEFNDVRSAVIQQRKVAFDDGNKATDAGKKAFYSERVDRYDSLLAKFDRILVSDTSQDANSADYPEER